MNFSLNAARRAIYTVVATFLVVVPALAAGQESVVGEWEMVTDFQGQEISATMTITIEDGEMVGVWTSQGQDMPMHEIDLDGNTLTFNRSMGQGGATLAFVGTVEGDEIKGTWSGQVGELSVTGKRAG
jgi:hypothetical protein